MKPPVIMGLLANDKGPFNLWLNGPFKIFY